MLSWLTALKAKRKQQRRLAKFEAAQAWSRERSVQQAFEAIYAENKWGEAKDGAQFSSGNGSRPEFSAPYEDFVVAFLRKHPELTRLVDIGCGDFQVSGRILARLGANVSYTGCDIVRPLIAHHQEKHARHGVAFRVLNAVEEDPPAGDVVFIRQILQHLSNVQVAAILERAKRLFKVAIITESVPVALKTPNRDIVHGIATRIALGSGVMIDRPPYNLKVAESLEVRHSGDEIIKTSVVWLGTPAGHIEPQPERTR